MKIDLMKFFLLVTTVGFLLCSFSDKNESKTSQLKVSENHRFLMDSEGKPFFWLGDTGWLLFSKLTREEAEKYLENRAEKGLNVIQVMVLHELKVTNVYGDSALICQDVSRPAATSGNSVENSTEYDFWDHMDFIIGKAGEKGIYMALVPVWGSNVKSGKISREQADEYSTWLAKRYAEKSNIIWLNGGDLMGSDSTAIWEIIGNNLRKNAPNQLITYHPFGRTQSSTWFHNASWLDFNMVQSGHRRYDQDDSKLGYGQDNWKYIRDDYNLTPVKPTIDGEPSYEGIPQGLHDTTQPRWNNNDLRRYAYWSVFAGAFGFTYGNNAVMQMNKPGDVKPSYGVKDFWYDAIESPGSSEMIHLKNLMLSKPFFERIPDQSLIVNNGEKYDFLAATRGIKYALIYTYNGRKMEINSGKIEGKKISAQWFNPRNGSYTKIGSFKNNGILTFDPPGEIQDGNDWVLVLDWK
jgi:hypothetical protein